MLNKVRTFISFVLPQVMRPLRVLWNQVMGSLFLGLAILPIPRTVRTWNEYQSSGEGLFQVLLSAVFIVIMGYFGVSSFFRARRASRT